MDNQAINQYTPDYTVTPGEVLEYELEMRHMSKSELAKRTGLTEKHLNTVFKGKGTVSITPETAIKLERTLGMPAEYWLNLEANYQETRARLAEAKQLEKDLDWLKRIPIAAMTKLGWLKKHRDKKQQLDALLRFFGIASVEQWDELWPKVAVAYRQHNKQEVFPEAVSAWLRQGEIEAASLPYAPFSKSKFREALDEIRNLTSVIDPTAFIPELQRLAAQAGVAVVLIPALPKTGVSGATRWLNPDKAIIQLSLRYKTNDHLWFTFFHEAGHILLHGKKELFIEGNNGMDAEKEEQANTFAAHELIPKRAFTAFSRQGQFSKASIVKFAHEVGIAPGIVVGQLQHRQLLPMSHCNDLKVRYQWVHD
ncbi:ImmA/IrrE family metallo-endopeptidase [Sedimenticola hydrogenitrophicus]|uniref:ImmA/IrrE family metallo-endopeptidase n=1 Tax=Sedimenticola hydrogenitrophicus TaxID=2967975 RepID=UPI0021A4F9C6|nr:ImmA/IrrE family metallo-endopeptidase [Sedimenticola hydrogenitrophicus]